MAKCTIIFEDDTSNADDPKLSMKVEFDPPLDNPEKGHTPTYAQRVGWEFFKAVSGELKDQERAHRSEDQK
jgi:hypothetical protein